MKSTATSSQGTYRVTESESESEPSDKEPVQQLKDFSDPVSKSVLSPLTGLSLIQRTRSRTTQTAKERSWPFWCWVWWRTLHYDNWGSGSNIGASLAWEAQSDNWLERKDSRVPKLIRRQSKSIHLESCSKTRGDSAYQGWRSRGTGPEVAQGTWALGSIICTIWGHRMMEWRRARYRYQEVLTSATNGTQV